MDKKRAREVLDVEEKATRGDIEKAARKKMRAAHPDIGGSTEATEEVQTAKKILLDHLPDAPTQKAIDHALEGGEEEKKHHAVFLPLTAGEREEGGRMKVSALFKVRCISCKGARHILHKKMKDCRACGGKRAVATSKTTATACQLCFGTGLCITPSNMCMMCKATGTMVVKRRLFCQVPPNSRVNDVVGEFEGEECIISVIVSAKK